MSRALDYSTLHTLSEQSGSSRIHHPWLTAASFVLLAYALMGKGAGYVGVPPVFIGEFLLIGGIAALFSRGKFSGTRLPGMLWCVLAFGAWGAVRTIPYVAVHGIDALRDAVIYGYAAFAFVWFFYLLTDPRRFIALLNNYERFAVIALIGMPAMWLARFLMADATPSWPWADTKIIELKAGDVMVHLSGILAFWISRRQTKVRSSLLWIFGISAGVMGAYERAGMLAMGMVFLLCMLVRPGHRVLRALTMMGLAGLAILAVSGITLEVPTAETSKVREISFRQFTGNVTSAILPSDVGDLDDTKEWRLQWWTEILHYTFKGPYFWAGKGFGVNLADDDGFQVMEDHSLRSPHNAHLMILARAGVPGLALWAIVQLGWAVTILSALRRSIRDGRQEWAGVFLLLLAYWLAFVINGAFDVYLEGPMGGIWFWSVYGIGLAAVWMRKRCPDLLRDYANPYSP